MSFAINCCLYSYVVIILSLIFVKSEVIIGIQLKQTLSTHKQILSTIINLPYRLIIEIHMFLLIHFFKAFSKQTL